MFTKLVMVVSADRVAVDILLNVLTAAASAPEKGLEPKSPSRSTRVFFTTKIFLGKEGVFEGQIYVEGCFFQGS